MAWVKTFRSKILGPLHCFPVHAALLLDPYSLEKFVDRAARASRAQPEHPGQVLTIGMYKTQHVSAPLRLLALAQGQCMIAARLALRSPFMTVLPLHIVL